MNLVIDCTQYGAKALDMAIVAYAANNYAYVIEPNHDSLTEDEYWAEESQWAIDWIDGIARNGGYTYFIEDNCLFTDTYEELSA